MFILSFLAEFISQILFLAGYVTGSNAFANPLSPDEEKTYLELYKNGDANAKNILIEHNLRLVAHISKKYVSESYDLEDLISIGTIGLIKGINTYDTDKNTRLAPYVSRCIENELLMMLRSSKKYSNEISIDECIGTDKEGNSMTLADILPSDEEDVPEIVAGSIEAERLHNAMQSVLKPSEADILSWRYGLNNTKKKTQKEIAEIMGISRSYISRIEKKALKKLSDFLKRNN